MSRLSRAFFTLLLLGMAAVFCLRLADGSLTMQPEEKPLRSMTLDEFLESSSLDINKASAADFEEFDGVGFIIARRIVDYRESIGGFSSVEQLDDVKYIGEKRMETMRPFVHCIPRDSG